MQTFFGREMAMQVIQDRHAQAGRGGRRLRGVRSGTGSGRPPRPVPVLGEFALGEFAPGRVPQPRQREEQKR